MNGGAKVRQAPQWPGVPFAVAKRQERQIRRGHRDTVLFVLRVRGRMRRCWR